MPASNVPKRGASIGDQVELSTPRLLLRAACVDDAEHLNSTFSDPEVMRYWSEPPHKDLDRTKAWFKSMINNSGNGVTDFIVCLKPDLMPVGKMGVWRDDEIGFILGREHWGKGLGREALKRIVVYLFEEKGFERLTADTDPRNEASIKLLKKVGFEEYELKERTFQVGNEWVDSLYLKLESEVWREKRVGGGRVDMI